MSYRVTDNAMYACTLKVLVFKYLEDIERKCAIYVKNVLLKYVLRFEREKVVLHQHMY